MVNFIIWIYDYFISYKTVKKNEIADLGEGKGEEKLVTKNSDLMMFIWWIWNTMKEMHLSEDGLVFSILTTFIISMKASQDDEISSSFVYVEMMVLC